ncbi:MAG: energy-coupling factor ABC transporter permease, partial [Candidatus Faecousia sp.]|nr:energy-coupling factor ABC transporter permease [Candidatus Faecousia sp.]
LLGPQAGFLSMVVILTIQCLFFADGGLLALGANCWNMAFYGCFVGYYLLWKPIMRSKLLGKMGTKAAGRIKIILASVLGCVITLQLGAFSVVLETSISGITELPLGAFVGIMQPIHLAIGLIEGLITSAVLVFVYEARPELLMDVDTSDSALQSKYSLKTTILILAVVVAIVGGGLSLAASSNPDGLEWSMFGNAEAGYSENMGLNEEDYGISSAAAEAAGSIQEKTAFLPDYAFADSESAAGTTVSGLVGSAIVAGVALLICMAGGFFRKKKVTAKA